MKATLFAAGYTGYLIFGLFQIAATASGIEHLTGLWWFMCWIGAILVGWVPVFGTALGIYGAHAQWEWSLPAAYALFIGLPILLFARTPRNGLARTSRRRGAVQGQHLGNVALEFRDSVRRCRVRAEELGRCALLGCHHLLPKSDRLMGVIAGARHELESHHVGFGFLLTAVGQLKSNCRDGVGQIHRGWIEAGDHGET